MREEPKIFGGGGPRHAPQGDDEERLSILGVEPEEPEAEAEWVEYEDEEVDEAPRRRLPWKILAVVVAVAIGAIGAALFMGVGDTPQTVADVPLITADPTPYKHQPDDPGGLQVPYQDVEVFDTMDEEEPEETYEVLLPEPEEPLESMPEEAVAETTDDGLEVIDVIDVGESGGEAAIVEGEEGADQAELAATAKVPPIPANPPRRPAAATAEPTTTVTTTTEPSTDSTASGDLSFDDVAASLSGETTSEPQPQTVAPAAGGPKVQFAAYSSEQNALDAWAFLKGQQADLLGGYQPVIDTAALETGTLYRLQVGPFGSDAEARQLCDTLRSRQVDCIVVTP
jgi:hypothetical protein